MVSATRFAPGALTRGRALFGLDLGLAEQCVRILELQAEAPLLRPADHAMIIGLLVDAEMKHLADPQLGVRFPPSRP